MRNSLTQIIPQYKTDMESLFNTWFIKMQLSRPALGSGFNTKSTTNNVIKGIELRGKIAIVTGLAAGATVVVPAQLR